jgi:hypothetical protein
MSFGRRMELMKRVKSLTPRLECFRAGTSQQDRIEASLLSAEIDRLYIEWGLTAVSGLEIDGAAADPASLAALGPEALFHEALRCVKDACRLSEAEIKN